MSRFRKAIAVAVGGGLLSIATALPASAWQSQHGCRAAVHRPTIAAIVAQSGGSFDSNPFDYDILLNAVKTAGLVDALNDPNASLTVFAPNDAAFIRTAQSLGYEGRSESGAWNFLVGALTKLGNGDPVPVLKTVLLYHVTPGQYSLHDVLFARQLPTLAGPTIGVHGLQLIDKDPDLPDARVLIPNTRAANGIIHTITRVMLPINI